MSQSDEISEALAKVMEGYRGRADVLVDDIKADLEKTSGGAVTIHHNVGNSVVFQVVADGKGFVVRLND